MQLQQPHCSLVSLTHLSISVVQAILDDAFHHPANTKDAHADVALQTLPACVLIHLLDRERQRNLQGRAVGG